MSCKILLLLLDRQIWNTLGYTLDHKMWASLLIIVGSKLRANTMSIMPCQGMGIHKLSCLVSSKLSNQQYRFQVRVKNGNYKACININAH